MKTEAKVISIFKYLIMRKIPILSFFLLLSLLGYSQTPFIGDRLFISSDRQDSLWIKFKTDSIYMKSNKALHFNHALYVNGVPIGSGGIDSSKLVTKYALQTGTVGDVTLNDYGIQTFNRILLDTVSTKLQCYGNKGNTQNAITLKSDLGSTNQVDIMSYGVINGVDLITDSTGIHYSANPDTSLFGNLHLVNKRWVLDRIGGGGSLDSSKLVTKHALQTGLLGNVMLGDPNNVNNIQLNNIETSLNTANTNNGTATTVYLDTTGLINLISQNAPLNRIGSYFVDWNGLRAQDNYVNRNLSNPRWIPDKNYVDSLKSKYFPYKKTLDSTVTWDGSNDFIIGSWPYNNIPGHIQLRSNYESSLTSGISGMTILQNTGGQLMMNNSGTIYNQLNASGGILYGGNYAASFQPQSLVDKNYVDSLHSLGSGGSTWGSITGTLSNQTDLSTALAGKEATMGNPSVNGYLLSSTTTGTRSWIAPLIPTSGVLSWNATTKKYEPYSSFTSNINKFCLFNGETFPTNTSGNGIAFNGQFSAPVISMQNASGLSATYITPGQITSGDNQGSVQLTSWINVQSGTGSSYATWVQTDNIMGGSTNLDTVDFNISGISYAQTYYGSSESTNYLFGLNPKSGFLASHFATFNLGTKRTYVETDGSVNIPTGATYQINGVALKMMNKVNVSSVNYLYGDTSGAFLKNTTANNLIGYGVGLFKNTTTANYDLCIGLNAGAGLTTGNDNVLIGIEVGKTLSTGIHNVALGSYSLNTNSTGTNNVTLGYHAGRYETGSNTLYIDNQERSNTAGEKAGALLYGVGSTTPSSQTLTTNSAFTATYGVTTSQYKLSALNTAPASATATGTLGEIRVTATYIYVCTATNTWVRAALATW